MGRRALPSLSPDADVSRTLLSFEGLPKPWLSAEAFDEPGPLEIEVGSGKGLFLSAASEQRPGHNFLGIEIAHKYARFAATRLAKRGRTNARVLSGDALRFFREHLPDACVNAVHVYYPDPWWKKRHRRRRVLNEAFLRDATRVLIPGGRLHVWTDVREYHESTLELIAAKTPLEGPFEPEVAPPEHDLDYRTHRDRRVCQAGLPVYRSEFVRPISGSKAPEDVGV